MKIATLYSGSSGNATLIYNDKTKILIDIGKSASATNKALADLGINIKDINAILVTHEHSDHIKGIKVFNKESDIPIYGKEKCITYIDREQKCNSNNKLYDISKGFYINDLYVNFFDTSHDSLDSCGFCFTDENNKKISVVTDVGEITTTVLDAVTGSDTVLIESNYDDNIIAMSSYPQFLKTRIKSNKGHLSNDDCGKAVNELVKTGTKNFMLAHLSRENNMPLLALQTVKYSIDKQFVDNVNIKIANRDKVTYI